MPPLSSGTFLSETCCWHLHHSFQAFTMADYIPGHMRSRCSCSLTCSNDNSPVTDLNYWKRVSERNQWNAIYWRHFEVIVDRHVTEICTVNPLSTQSFVPACKLYMFGSRSNRPSLTVRSTQKRTSDLFTSCVSVFDMLSYYILQTNMSMY